MERVIYHIINIQNDCWIIKMISPQSFYIRVCLKIAFRQLCVPLCRRFGPNEGGIAGMNFQTRPGVPKSEYHSCLKTSLILSSVQISRPLYHLTWHVLHLLPIHAFNPCILQLKLTKLER